MRPELIETRRLRLRPSSLSDVDELHQLWTDPGVRQYLWDDEVIPRERAESVIKTSLDLFAERGLGLWAIMQKSGDELIGFCGFWFFHEPPKLELLYAIAPAYWNRGLASEAAEAMMRYGFEKLSLERIEASTDAANLASVRVMEKAGMSFWKREMANGLDTVYFAASRPGRRAHESKTTLFERFSGSVL